MTIEAPRKDVPLRGLALDWDDVKKIYRRLSQCVDLQGQRAVTLLQRRPEQTDPEFERLKQEFRQQGFKVTVTIKGADGESLFGENVDVFDSPLLPETVASVYMTNTTAHQAAFGSLPLDQFELLLDFSKPALMDSNPVSSPTPNSSGIVAQGRSATWVSSILDAVLGVTKGKENGHGPLHRAFIYDLGVWVFALPYSIYLCWRLSAYVSKYFGVNAFLQAAVYAYIIVIVLWCYRILFGYSKWAFPLMELRRGHYKATGHRAFWGVIVVGLLVELLAKHLW